MKVIGVNPLPDYKLQVTFDDGVSGVIDLKEFIKNGIFSVLKKEEVFNKVYSTGYSVAWSDELEIDSLAIYAEILERATEDVFYDPEFTAKIQESREQVKRSETRVVNIAELGL